MSKPLDQVPSRVAWPTIIYLAAIIGAIILSYAVPLPWFGAPLSHILFAAGWILAAAAMLLWVGSLRALRRAKTTIMPTKGASHLVTSGPYAFSRNPIYLGNTVMMLAIGMIAGQPWFFLFGLIAGFTTQKLAIEPEERHLALRFGKKYRDYQKRVRRWF
ncbi:isoprenylcysteine carboxylmethyltransferase family protein [Chelativorans sp. Marseille-P2723]|uniref:methyltransferase family protein n=1 Tax=Chelativorans sp. Marseille-P2723 TaxID=2709133 RepID=UPI001570B129|nr:isoprenylcysteine carboxylmethyltransferase family protein [Chelativorans sp. Marseille-P2723]